MSEEDIKGVAKRLKIDLRTFRKYIENKSITPETRKKVEAGLDEIQRPDLLRASTISWRACDAFLEECKANGKIAITAEGAREKVSRWVEQGWRIGVFENHDLGHPDIGQKSFTPLKPEDTAEIGKAYNLGWRYILVSVHTSIEDFAFFGGPYHNGP